MSRVGLTPKELEQLRYWRGRIDIEGLQTAPWSSVEAVLKQQLTIIDMLLKEIDAKREERAA